MVGDRVPVLSFRVESTLRVVSLAVGIPVTGLVVVAMFLQHTVADVTPAIVTACLMWAGFSWFPFAARVDLFGDRLELVNPWGTRVIPIDQINRLSGNQFLTVRTHDGVERIAWAVQGSNLAVQQRRETRASRVAAAITEAIAQQVHPTRPGSQVQRRWTPPPWIFVAGEIALLILGIVAYRRVV